MKRGEGRDRRGEGERKGKKKEGERKEILNLLIHSPDLAATPRGKPGGCYFIQSGLNSALRHGIQGSQEVA